MKIIIKNEQKIIKKISILKVKKFAENVMKYMKCQANTQIGIMLVDNEEIKVLNKKYRNLDRPTDVLAFAIQESLSPKFHPEIIGDVVISVERANEQAPEYNHTFDEEFDLLIVHGILHLLGYDHIKSKDDLIMKPLEEELMKKFSVQKKWKK